ncbi:MAG: hypothetical protein QOH56_492 [Pseudonocardiales bacterium]|jgi:hypothetical protein|nr:hypothetical protein [Pseudonocardiales bacterium]
MSSLTQSNGIQSLRRAAVRGSLAASVHNTQPWTFVVGTHALEIHADPKRRLSILDPAGRQMIISCGCALFNVRVSLAANGYRSAVERFPDPGRPDVLARLTIVHDPSAAASDLAALNPLIDLRRTNRRRFAEDAVPEDLVSELVSVAGIEGAQLVPVTRAEDRVVVSVLSQRADAQENADPAYRAELRAWTTDDARRGDGVPALAVPHGGVGAHDDVPIRDFDTSGTGSLPTETRSSLNQCLLLLGTDADTPAAWLRTGEALERLLLEVTRHGYSASPMTQIIEVPNTRALLRTELRLKMQPQILLRIGRAPATPATRRRRLVEVLVESA